MPDPGYLEIERARTKLETAGYELGTLAHLPYSEELFVAVRPGDSGRRVLITAGSHADEVAGVLGAVKVALDYEGPHSLHVIPFRDPLGWRGFRRALERDLGAGDLPRIGDHEEARAVLREKTRVLFDDGDLIVGKGSHFAYASRHYSDFVSSDLARYQLQDSLPEVALDELREWRVVLPGNVANTAKRGPYDWGVCCAYVGDDGWVGHFNRFFDRNDAPPEVEALRSYVEELEPDLTLDLHEGFGDGFYLFVPTDPDPETLQIAETMMRKVVERGGSVADMERMRRLWREEVTASMVEYSPGIFAMAKATGNERGTFNAACDPFGPCITTEPGMNEGVAARIAHISAATTAALEAFTNMEEA